MSRQRRKYDSKRSKEIEVNVPEDEMNEADFPKHDTDRNISKSKPQGKSKKRNNRTKKSNRNDSSWYTRISSMVDSSARVVSTWPLGKQIDYNYPAGVTVAVPTLPGVMQLQFIPTIGYSQSNTSQVSMAFNKLHAYLQSTVSVSIDPDPADLGMYMFSWDNIFMWYNSLVRVYATLNAYDPQNMYYPGAIVGAEGFNLSNLVANKANLEFFINDLANKLSQFNVPAGFDFMTRHLWMTSGVYLDTKDTAKAQSYVFTPRLLYVFVEQDTTQPGHMEAIDLSTYYGNGIGYNDIVTITNTLVNPVLNSGDMRDISALMLRAFGRSNMMAIAPVQSGIVIIPTYRPEVLEQINNATILPPPDLSNSTIKSSFDITQGELDTGEKTGAIMQACLWSNTSYGGTMALYTANKLLNVMSGDYSAGNVLEASRFMVIGNSVEVDPDPTVADVLVLDNYGTEIMVAGFIWYYGIGSSGQPQLTAMSMLPSFDQLNNQTKVSALTAATCFDWHPSTIVVDSLSAPTRIVGNACEYQDFTIIGRTELNKLHETALASLFTNSIIEKLSAKPFNK